MDVVRIRANLAASLFFLFRKRIMMRIPPVTNRTRTYPLWMREMYRARRIERNNPMMRRAGPLLGGAVLLVLLLGLAPGVADPAPATRGNTTAGAEMGITARF